MTALITTLIDKVDNVEIVRDQIAAILVLELENQQALAEAAGRDSREWAVKVFTERGNPWSDYLVPEKDQLDVTPIANVYFERATVQKKKSNVVERQWHEGRFHIDGYGCGLTAETQEGHAPGDQVAKAEAHRAMKLCRNILMSSQYVYLGLQGLGDGRFPSDSAALEPSQDNRSVQQIAAMKMTLEVGFNEFAPQYTPETLEEIGITILRKDHSGQVYLAADYIP